MLGLPHCGNVFTVRVLGSTTQTIPVPNSRKSDTFLFIPVQVSSSRRTSTINSGAIRKNSSLRFSCGSLRNEMNATSAPRLSGGSSRMRIPRLRHTHPVFVSCTKLLNVQLMLVLTKLCFIVLYGSWISSPSMSSHGPSVWAICSNSSQEIYVFALMLVRHYSWARRPCYGTAAAPAGNVHALFAYFASRGSPETAAASIASFFS